LRRAVLTLLLLHLRGIALLPSLPTLPTTATTTTTSSLALLHVRLALRHLPQLLDHVLFLPTIVVSKEHGELGFQDTDIRKIVEGLHATGGQEGGVLGHEAENDAGVMWVDPTGDDLPVWLCGGKKEEGRVREGFEGTRSVRLAQPLPFVSNWTCTSF
jgi:hypothetical protein